MPTYAIPCGAYTTLLQNVAYATPAVRHILSSSANLEVGITSTGPWVAAPVGENAAPFVRCTTGLANVIAKKF